MKTNFHYSILLCILIGILISLVYEAPFQYDFSNYLSLKRAGLEDWIIGSVPKTAKNIRLKIKTEKTINKDSKKDPSSLDYEIQRTAEAEFDLDATTLQKIRQENCPEVITASQSFFRNWDNLFGLLTKASRFEHRSCGHSRQLTIDLKKNRGIYIYRSN